MVTYYLVLAYFPQSEIEKFSLSYFLYAAPVMLFVGLQITSLIKKEYTRKSVYTLIFLLLVIIISILRADFNTIFSIALFSLTMLVIFNLKISPSIRFLNVLFILSIIGSVISFHVGANEFGYIPNFANMGSLLSGSVGWRISLFPLVTESGFFALLIIIGNYYLNNNSSKYPFIVLGLYFLIFSGSRTSLIIFAFFIIFILLNKFFKFRNISLYRYLNTAFVVFFILTLSLSSLLLVFKDMKSEFLNEYVFRTNEGLQESEVKDVSTRYWIWEQHFKIYSQNPLIGVGTFDYNLYKGPVTKSYQQSNGSESFLTGLLARVGLLALFIILIIYEIQRKALMERNRFTYILSLYIFLTMISYGSFIVAYNFMFLLLIGFTNSEIKKDIS